MKTIIKLLLVTVFLASGLQALDVGTDLNSDTNQSISTKSHPRAFGENLFNGSFSQNRQYRFDPNYLINVGDIVEVKLWGAFEFTSPLTVDKQGNIFIPKVGTVALLGSRSDQLADKVKSAVRKVYNNNVFVYADLQNYQPVSVFVTGGVQKPGLYEGLSSDSIIQFIDKARGINPYNGSYRRIEILRDNKVYKRLDLYEFLLNGKLELFQFKMGDVVVVKSLESSVEVKGDVKRVNSFELLSSEIPFNELSSMAIPNPSATNVVVTTWEKNNKQASKIYSLKQASKITVKEGSTVEFLPDHTAQTISINIEGEHQNLHTVLLPKGSTLDQILKQIQYSPLSNLQAVQLFRKSVAERQKELLEAQLRDLEQTALTTGSATTEEAMIRRQESQSILDFVARAKQVQPKGQVVINSETDLSKIALEDGDTIYIPSVNRTVIVQGEVMLPGAQTYVDNLGLEEYIASSGGYNFRANRENILIVHPNGKADTYDEKSLFSSAPKIIPGDSIMVLGKVDSKNLQIFKDITQILYQIAVGAAVVLKAY